MQGLDHLPLMLITERVVAAESEEIYHTVLVLANLTRLLNMMNQQQLLMRQALMICLSKDLLR
jgi:hypothetical protein